ncbi:hypothetical protein GCM10025331_71420 [Actinoplanes utahensis]|nr:hypothetical protein Aut01nite_84180 [Actinoplanes utahensis]
MDTDTAPLSDDPPDLDAETDIGTYQDIETYSPVHAGRDVDQSRHSVHVARDQYVDSTVIFQQVTAAVTSILKKRHTTAETLAEQLRRYRPPDGLQEMTSRLATDRVLVLLCPAEVRRCGQRAAAAYLVHRINESAPSGEALDLQEFEDEEMELEETARSAADVALYFDFAAQGSSPATADRLRQLSVLEPELAAAGCVAIMAISDDHAEEAHKQFPRRVHTLRRTPPETVFRAQANRLPPAIVDDLVSDERITRHLKDAWPPHATWLAKLAAQAHASGITDVGGIIGHIDGALSNWREQAREQLHKHLPGPTRALLLATALLEGCEPLTIVAARDLLLQASRYPVDQVNVLEGTDVVTELQSLDEDLLQAGTTRFKRAGFGSALLNLAWREYPKLQPVLLNWIDRIPSIILGQSATDLDGLTRSVVALAAHDGSGQIAVQVAQRWTNVSARFHSARRGATVLVLRAACLHPRIGHDMRRRTYEKSYYRSQSPRFRAALAEAIGWFDISHQAAAMTRLKHLARGPEEEVTTAVEQAVIRLAGEMDLAQLLRYLTEWFSDDDPRRAEVAAAAAARAMATPGTLRARSGSAADSVAFWRKSMDCLPSETVAGLIRSLLRFADAFPGERDTSIQVLCDAAGTDLRRIGQLFYATRPADQDPAVDGPLNDLFQQVRLQLDEMLPASWAGEEEDR